MSFLARCLAVGFLLVLLTPVLLQAPSDASVTETPRTAEVNYGNRYISYTIFTVLAGMGLILIFRGIRAR